MNSTLDWVKCLLESKMYHLFVKYCKKSYPFCFRIRVFHWLLIIWYSKFSIEMLQSGAQILRALRLEDQ